MATIDIFNLSPRDFNLQMQEEAMYRTPAELDELRREYRNRNSMAGKLMGLLAPEEGKRRSTFLPVDAPQGMSIFDALRSGQATPAVPQGLVDLITGGTRGVESAREYAQGVPPRADALNDALAMSGLAMTGGGAVGVPRGAVGANAVRNIKDKYPDVEIDIYGDADRGYELGRIQVPKDQQSSGVGSQVMNDLIAAADAEGAKISLTPDTSFGGTSVSRLKDFYKRFGFVENKGRNKDFSTRNTMYRDPTAMANASKSTGLLTSNVADLRRQANIERFGYDPNETPEVDTSYRGGHQPVGPQDENPVRLDDVTISTTGEQAGYPSDFYSGQGQRLYAQGPRFSDDEFGIANQQSYRAIQAARGNPDAEVTIYRGVPNEESITSINAGDFVTLSPKYAELHASSGYGPRGEDAGKVISQKVKVKDVYFAGDDVNEFGYFPDTTAANASKSTGLLVVEQQARGNKKLGDLFESQNVDISTATTPQIENVLDMAQRRGILDPRSAFNLKRGLLD